MRNLSILFFLLAYVSGFTQSVKLFNPVDNSPYPSQLYFCPAETFNLKVDAVATSTGDYIIQPLSGFNISAPSTTVPFSNKIGNDHFSQPISIPFTFDFFGKQYSRLVVGANGRLIFGSGVDFDNLHTNRYVDKVHSGNDASSSNVKIPDVVYNQIDSNDFTTDLKFAQIFFGYTDLGFYSASYFNKLTYGAVKYNGIDGLLINFDLVLERTVGTGYNSTITSQVLILKDNSIIIKILKPNASKNAIIGVQNQTGNLGRWPTNSEPSSPYNNDKWSSNGSESWLFKPNQNLTPKFKWFQNATLLGETSNTLSGFVPTDGDVLKVEVAYFNPAGVQVGAPVSDQVIFNKIKKPIITSNSAGGCVSGVKLTVPNDPDLNFEWLRVGNTNVLGTGNTYYATQTGRYFVRASRKTLPICSVDSDPVPVNLNSTIPPFNVNNVTFDYCDNSSSPSKVVNLYDYYAQGPNYTVTFLDGTQTIANPAAFPIPANTVKTITINVNDPTSGCSINQNFTIRFDSLPATINNLQKKFCFGETSVDVSQYLQDLAGTNFTVFDYLYSTDGTNYNSTSVFNPKQYPKIWVKISPKNNPASTCTTISTIVFTEDIKVIANTPTTQLPPQCASSTQTFNLASLIPEINPDPNVTVTFYESLQNAIDGVGAVPYQFRSGLGSTTLFIRVVNNLTGCVSPDHPPITLLVYKKPQLLVTSLTKANCAGNSIFNLTQNPASLTDAVSPVTVTLEYYSTNGTLLTSGQITNYDANTFGLNPYIKVIYNTTCSDTIPFTLSYNLKPVAGISQILICAELTYSLQDFQNSVITNPANYTFTDDTGNPLPNSFDVSVLPKTIKFLIKDKVTGCLSDLQTVTFVRGGNSVLLGTSADIEKCDTDFDGKVSFNLDDVKTTFTADPDATFEYFKDAGFSKSITSNYTNENAFAQKIFVRVTLAGFCPSSAEINLKVNIPTRSTTLEDKYFVCFGETVTVDAGSENVSWQWSTGETTQTVDFTIPGNYSVVLTNLKGCSYTHNFIISDENQPKIEIINQTNTSIEVIANGGVKPYRYYFNGVPQSSNILQNPTASSYEIQVESATGCFGPPKTVYFIKINNAFTPNADGINDVWKIDNLDKMQQVSIMVLDRNGTKVFESTNPAKTEWDGRNNGRPLPTSTYWYVVTWFDGVTQKSEQRQGWILLKNRN